MAARSWWREAAGWVPIVLVFAYMAYSYYVFVVVLSTNYLLYERNEKVQGALYIAFYNLILLFAVPAYVRTVWPDGYRRPQDYGDRLRLAQTPEEVAEAEATAPLEQRTSADVVWIPPSEDVRFCTVCQFLKPARTHHCSACRTCILKMDHHCVWLNTCVGHANYKFFLVFLFWACIGCAFLAAAILQVLIWQLSTERLSGNSIQYLLVLVFAFVFWLAAFSLLMYHLGLLVPKNMSTIEHLDWQEARKLRTIPDELQHVFPLHDEGHPRPRILYSMRPYNISCLRNWQQVFGRNPLLWAIPVWTTQGAGVRYPRHGRAVP